MGTTSKVLGGPQASPKFDVHLCPFKFIRTYDISHVYSFFRVQGRTAFNCLADQGSLNVTSSGPPFGRAGALSMLLLGFLFGARGRRLAAFKKKKNSCYWMDEILHLRDSGRMISL